MESTRQQKFSKLIQKELSEIFLRDGKAYFGKSFVTITQVKMTPDLSLARIHLSVMGSPKPEETIEHANNASREIRGKLGTKIRNHVRHIPDLEFFLDGSLEYADNIERLFKEINSKKNT